MNAIERLWQELKKQLRWCNFPSLQDLRQALALLLEELTPEHVLRGKLLGLAL